MTDAPPVPRRVWPGGDSVGTGAKQADQVTQTCETCGRSWGDRAMFCGACGALLNRPLPSRGDHASSTSSAWWRRPLVVGGVVAAALVGVVAAVPTLSIERQDPVDTSIDVPDSDDLQAAPADATLRPHVDPPEITCSQLGIEYDCIVWSRQVIQPRDSRGDGGPTWAFAASRGVVVADDQRVDLIDVADGARLWSIDTPSHGFPRGLGDEFMVFSDPGTTRVIDLADGQTRWTFDGGGSVGSDWIDGEVIYTGATGPTDAPGVTARDVDDGTDLWTWETAWEDVSLQHLAADRLLATSYNTGESAILDASSGREVARVGGLLNDWVLGVADGVAVTVQVLDHGEPSDANPAGDGGAVLAGVDVETGTVRWEQEVRASQASFGMHDGLVLAPSARHLTALDTATGETVWEVPTASSEVVADHGGWRPWRPPSLDDSPPPEHVLTVDQRNGLLRARAPQSGEQVWQRPLTGQPWHASVVGEDEVVVFGGEHLHVLHASTGQEVLRLDAREQQFVQFDPLIVFDHRSGYLTRVDVPDRAS